MTKAVDTGKEIAGLIKKISNLSKEVAVHRAIVDKALDKLRKALPHVNFED